jgi:microcin C transport system permease protein
MNKSENNELSYPRPAPEQKLAWRFKLSYLVLAFFVGFSLTADLWSNSAPLVLRYAGQTYFPALRELPASQFGIQDRLLVDYKKLKLGADDFAIWPVNRWSPQEINRQATSYPLKPSTSNWLGTDDRGRDVFSRLLYGARLTILFATAVGILSTFIALVIGAVAGFLGGWVDLISQRVIEVFSTIPQLFILIFLVTIFEPSMKVLIAVNVVFGWIGTSYYIRAEALRIRNLEFVSAAISYGASRTRIIFRHVIPNALGPAITLSPFIVIGNVTALTALDFMGLGLPPPAPSWGELLAQGQTYFSTAWWLAIFPTLILFILLLTVAMIGEHLRLWYENPHVKKERGDGNLSFGQRWMKRIGSLIRQVFVRRA